MFLKALTLKGFKSFAEATVLEMQPGVTVVVGPNGSGKSNVVDAIGWVLGAQAPSAVRSQKREAVIFGGTTRRPALGRAEVSLTIDNSAGLLPIEFTEVTVTRTLWRSGDSEYALNGVPCRLLDVQELFSDTGVGRQQHVIVGQGQIDAVLNAKPEERRLVIEEAAGILKQRLGALTAARAELRNEETLLKQRLTELDTAVLTAESRLGALGGSEVGDLLAALEALREKARGQLALLAERRRGVDRERAAFVNQDVIASLEADSAQLRAALASVDADAAGLAPEAEALAAAESEVAEARAGFEREWVGVDVPAPSGRAAEVRGELGALRAALAQADGGQRRTGERVAQLRTKLERLVREAAEAAAQIAVLERTEPELAAAVESAGARRATTEAAAQAAGQRRGTAQAERHAWAGRRGA